jgi:AmmeMemoRadiSam system protein B
MSKMDTVDRSQVRPSVIAGSWYPDRPAALRATIERYLNDVEPMDLRGKLVGLIVPHAGYIYSGQVAAHAYKQLEGRDVDLVVLISPVHRMYVGAYMVTHYAYYETSLGLVPVAGDLVEELGEQLELTRVRRDEEHSLEIQLPFLQYLLSEFRLLPIMLGDQSWDACQQLASALATLLQGERALLVASTDLSHYHPYDQAVQLDRRVGDRVEAFDPRGLSEDLAAHRAEACGGGPVITVMLTARSLGADRARVLHYANSGDVTGDRSQVVGYMAAALFKAEDGS